MKTKLITILIALALLGSSSGSLSAVKQTMEVEPWLAEVYVILCANANVCTGRYVVEAPHDYWRSTKHAVSVRGDLIVLYDAHVYQYLCAGTWDNRFGFANCVWDSVGFFSSLYHNGFTPRETVDAIVEHRAQNLNERNRKR